MNATDELRRMLDERGAEHEDYAYVIADTQERCEITRIRDYAGRIKARFMSCNEPGKVDVAVKLTPKQAIAATLGRGECETCHAESDLSEWVCSECQCWIPLGLTTENIGRASEWRYCPHCGRKVVE